jgi:hypothetical protein
MFRTASLLAVNVEQLAASVDVREMSQQATAQAIRSLEKAADEKRRADFVRRASRLHHLVSTRAQPGALKSPVQVALGKVPVFDGTPLEDHFRLVCKHTVRVIFSSA